MPKQTKADREPVLTQATLSTDTQLIYAEQMIGIAVGPFISKIVLGMDDAPNAPIPKFTIVMPTNALHQAAKQIVDVLSNQSSQEQIASAFKAYQESV